jgi:DNA-binding NarL/FixJ family response regulator
MITIGIIDDHGIVLQGVSNIFAAKSDYKVLFAINNLSEANTTLEQTQPQVLFLDINIKGDDGLEALKVFKKKYAAMKVVMLTSFEETALVKTALRNGADGYLLKDASEQDFLSAIEKCIERRTIRSKKRTGFNAERSHGSEKRYFVYSKTHAPRKRNFTINCG